MTSGVVFTEIPDEVTLELGISNCPYRCEGCHSPFLQADVGEELTWIKLKEMLETTKYIGIKAAIVFSYTNREGVTTISNSVLLLDSNLKTLDYICNQEEFNQIKETITKIQENQ